MSLNASAKPFNPAGIATYDHSNAFADDSDLNGIPQPRLRASAPSFVPTTTTGGTATVADTDVNGSLSATAAPPASTAPTGSLLSLLPVSAPVTSTTRSVPASKRVRKLKAATDDDDTARNHSAPTNKTFHISAFEYSASQPPKPSAAVYQYTKDQLNDVADALPLTANNPPLIQYFADLILNGANATQHDAAPADSWREHADITSNNVFSSPAAGGIAAAPPSPSATPSLRPGANTLRPNTQAQIPATSGGAPQHANKRSSAAASSSSSNKHSQAQQSGGNGGSGGAGSGSNRRRPVEADIVVAPLVQTANRYVLLKDIPPDAKLLREVKAILNKLTPEKFDVLVNRILALNITTDALLRDVVTAVFEKALSEPNFSPTYAEFAVALTAKLPTFTTPANETVTFKRLLLNTAQTEFQTDSTVVAENTNITGTGNTAADADDILRKRKLRTLGTIRFIGELFIRSLLAPAIIRYCITLLLGDIVSSSDEDIEALCKLIETVGSTMELTTAKDANINIEFMNKIFIELNQLSTDKRLSSRMRFMLLDIVELRKRHWINRRKVETAKKLADFRASNGVPQPPPNPNDTDDSAITTSTAPPQPTISRPVRPRAVGRTDRYAIKAPSESPANSPSPPPPSVSPMPQQQTQTHAVKADVPKPRARLSDDELERLLEPIFSDLSAAHDVAEAATAIAQLNVVDDTRIITRAIMFAIDRTERDAQLIGEVLSEILLKHIIRSNEVINATTEFMQNSFEDLIIDIPVIRTLLAAVYAPSISKRTLTLRSIGQMQFDTKLVCRTFAAIIRYSSAAHFLTITQEESLPLVQLLDPTNRDVSKAVAQLKQEKLDAIVSAVGV